MSKFYCPTCKNELEEMNACGSISYFCNHCKGLVSRSKMLSEDDLEASKTEDNEKNSNN